MFLHSQCCRWRRVGTWAHVCVCERVLRFLCAHPLRTQPQHKEHTKAASDARKLTPLVTARDHNTLVRLIGGHSLFILIWMCVMRDGVRVSVCVNVQVARPAEECGRTWHMMQSFSCVDISNDLLGVMSLTWLPCVPQTGTHAPPSRPGVPSLL